MLHKLVGMINRVRTGNALGLSPGLAAALAAPPVHTPDTAELESRQHNLVFLYGNHMTNGRQALTGVRPLYTDVYTADPFIMVKSNVDKMTVPVVLDRPPQVIGGVIGRQEKAPIKGQLYQLTAEEIEKLDRDHQNGVLFRRQRVRIVVEHHIQTQHQKEQRISEPLFYEKRVWMYIGNYERWSFNKLSRESYTLLKSRDDNPNYDPRYYYSPTDWE